MVGIWGFLFKWGFVFVVGSLRNSFLVDREELELVKNVSFNQFCKILADYMQMRMILFCKIDHLWFVLPG